MASAQGIRTRRFCACFVVLVALAAAYTGRAILSAQAPDAAPTLTISVKGSPVYAQPTPVALKTAALVITPSWQGLNATTPTGGREASGQPLWVSDVVVFLSNQEFDCGAVFKATAPKPEDFLIAAGRAEAYMPSAGWNNTPLGKAFSSMASNETKVPVDRFSLEAQYSAAKAKRMGKDGLRGESHLVLEQGGGSGGWIADIAIKADDLVLQGRIPVKSCGITTRNLGDMQPLLGQHRLQSAADKYGM